MRDAALRHEQPRARGAARLSLGLRERRVTAAAGARIAWLEHSSVRRALRAANVATRTHARVGFSRLDQRGHRGVQARQPGRLDELRAVPIQAQPRQIGERRVGEALFSARSIPNPPCAARAVLRARGCAKRRAEKCARDPDAGAPPRSDSVPAAPPASSSQSLDAGHEQLVMRCSASASTRLARLQCAPLLSSRRHTAFAARDSEANARQAFSHKVFDLACAAAPAALGACPGLPAFFSALRSAAELAPTTGDG